MSANVCIIGLLCFAWYYYLLLFNKIEHNKKGREVPQHRDAPLPSRDLYSILCIELVHVCHVRNSARVFLKLRLIERSLV